MKPSIAKDSYHKDAQVFKVLGNAKRLEILALLKQGEISVAELLKTVRVPKANLSQHLALLRSAGLVTSRREGLTVFYTLIESKLGDLLTSNVF